MIVNLSETQPEELDSYDLCIVGSGPAGGTIAKELADSGLRICVLESGQRKPTAYGDKLREVRSEGLFIKEYSRERVLGGASTTWAGLSSPLDPVDLEARPWIQSGGWPLSGDDLRPYYAQAAERYRFPDPSAYEAGGFSELKATGAYKPTWKRLEEKVFLAASKPQNFAKECSSIYEDGQVDLFLDATVLRLEGKQGNSSVDSLQIVNRAGQQFHLRAECFVLATGGIENARLLLLSTDQNQAGLGNEHDQVGRYFMNHPKNYCGILHLHQPVEELPYYFGCIRNDFAGYAGLRLSDQVQRDNKLVNSYVRFEPLFAWSDNQGIEALVLFVKRSQLFLRAFISRNKGKVITLRDYSETGDDSELQNARKNFATYLGLIGTVLINLPSVLKYLYFRLMPGAVPKIKRVRLRNFMEMEPDPDNRVVLAEETDVNGQPLPLVNSRCTDLDQRSLIELHSALEEELAATGLGRLETPLAKIDPWPITQDASHHVGTTRMGTDPTSSVVNPQQRIHAVDNVYLAGASVFPTSGCANPTMTIVALSIRLAEELRRSLTKESRTESA